MEKDLFAYSAEHGTPSGDDAGAGQTEQFVTGDVLRTVYTSEDRLYGVVRIRDDRKQELVLVGPVAELLEGQSVEAWGRWEKHKEYGRQFRATRIRPILPTTELGIRRYLASGLIPGIGEVYANRIVDTFGTRTLEILDRYSARLSEVPGIGAKRLQQIREAWQAHSQQRDIFVFLQGLGLGPAHCGKIFRRYGASSGEIVKQNPYRLASDVTGIGFLTADKIAGNLGVEKENPLRLGAGVGYVLSQLADAGHVGFPRDKLLAEAAHVLQVEVEPARLGLEKAIADGTVVADAEFTDATGEPTIYSRDLYQAETGLARSLAHLLQNAPAVDPRALPTFSGAQYEILNATQRQAVQAAFTSRLSIITGGPGVGKTTVVGRIVHFARVIGRSVLLAAPTGRAAKRLAESCHKDAKTIHRLLRWDAATKTFIHNRGKPLRTDLLVIDELSMLDVVLADHLFQAITPSTHVVLVGDKDQLPSVGPGNVLHDLINSGRIPVTHLTEVYRQSENSRIVTNAHSINRGQMPDLRPLPPNVLGDFYWIDQEDPERVVAVIAALVAERIPKRFRFDPMTDIQVLAPMNRGNCGSHALNDLLQRTLNGGERPEIRFGERLFRQGDRVMQVSNNYDKGVFNGEMGQIVNVDTANKKFLVAYDIGNVEYEWFECDQIRLAYAVTVHKSQGSEFPVVIMPLLSQHFVMLQRNLVYTGMTRARKLLIMVGSRRALAMAIRNDKPAMRFTRLAQRLKAQ